MSIEMTPIGTVHTDVKEIPRFWSVSDVEGTILLDEQYREGLKGINPGDRIVVIFYFHQSRTFEKKDLTQYPRGDTTREKKGVFNICSPIRPNPLGMSVLTVLAIERNVLFVTGIDMRDGTPILDIKPYRI